MFVYRNIVENLIYVTFSTFATIIINGGGKTPRKHFKSHCLTHVHAFQKYTNNFNKLVKTLNNESKIFKHTIGKKHTQTHTHKQGLSLLLRG